MPIGTCNKCGARVVWDAREIDAHRRQCIATPAANTEEIA